MTNPHHLAYYVALYGLIEEQWGQEVEYSCVPENPPVNHVDVIQDGIGYSGDVWRPTWLDLVIQGYDVD